MSIVDCLKGKVPPDTLKELQAEHEVFLKNADGDLAKADVIMGEQITKRLESKKNADLKLALDFREATDRINAISGLHKELDGRLNKAAQITAKLLGKIKAGGKRSLIEFLSSAERSGKIESTRLLAGMEELNEAIRAKGFQFNNNTELMKQVLREYHGVKTDNAIAKQLAENLKKSMDAGVNGYRAAGGEMGYISKYTPIRHIGRKIPDNFEEWFPDYRKIVDLKEMTDFRTGKPMTEARFKEISEAMHKSIKGGDAAGEAKRAGKHGIFSTLSLKGSRGFGDRMSARFTRIGDVDAFMEYNKKYGVGDEGIYEIFVHALRDIGHDTGIMKEMGSNPDLILQGLKSKLIQAEDLTINGSKEVDAVYNTMLNRWEGSVDNMLTTAVSTSTQLLSSALLGTAAIMGFGDTVYVRNAAKLYDITGGDMLAGYFKALGGNPKNAIRMHSIAESMSYSAMSRHMGDEVGWAGNKITQLRSANTRWTGLERVTLASADMLNLGLVARLGELVDDSTKFADLHLGFTELMSRSGIYEKEWDELVKLGSGDKGMLTPAVIEAGGLHDLARRVGMMEVEVRAIATNSPDLLLRAVSTGRLGLEAKTAGGGANLLMTAIMQLKSFPIQVYRNHFVPRIVNAVNGDVVPLGVLTLQVGMAGMMIDAAYNLVSGKPAYDYEDETRYGEYFFKGLVRAGFGGIVGGLLMSDPDKLGENLVKTAVGVNITSAAKLIGGGAETISNFIDGDWDAQPAFKAAKTYVPLHNAWPIRAGYERVVNDTIMSIVDPQYQQNVMKRRIQTMKDGNIEMPWHEGVLQ